MQSRAAPECFARPEISADEADAVVIVDGEGGVLSKTITIRMNALFSPTSHF
jgi:hypothetical protein